ncbi:MAG: hypothetical protein A3H31_09580 [Gallionellales bacterium RIFCSPLOWO2_02_FULL_57_47]|nr:MAG: hypothetical protein A3H31_09580 [Gallionellales bacterium RIFCSPLOWO2_02_FULL_57_47]
MGTALYQVQGVEEILAKYHSIAFKLSDSPTLQEINNEFDRNFSHTAGMLVGLLRNERGADDQIAKRLSEFVDERAWLVHKLRRTDYLSLRDESGFQAVMRRVAQLENECEQLIELFHSLLVEYFISLGTPREHIEKEHEKALREIYGE